MTTPRLRSITRVLAAFSLRPVRRLCSYRGCRDLATIYGYCFDHGG